MFWVNGFCILLGKKPYNLNVNLKKIKGIQFAAFPKSFFLIKTSLQTIQLHATIKFFPDVDEGSVIKDPKSLIISRSTRRYFNTVKFKT